MNNILQERILSLVGTGEYSGGEIALKLGVSISTVARTVAALKRKGIDIISLRRGLHWYYELRNPRLAAAADPDPFLALRGFVRSGVTDYAERHDDYLYGTANDRPVRYGRKRKRS